MQTHEKPTVLRWWTRETVIDSLFVNGHKKSGKRRITPFAAFLMEMVYFNE